MVPAHPGNKRWPGEKVIDALPLFGEDGEFDEYVDGDGGYRVFVWKGLVIVLHQNCEIANAHEEDSRLVVAPVVSPAQWPSGQWTNLRENRLPGYFYLPESTAEEDEVLEGPIPEGVVVFASCANISRELLLKTRIARVSHDHLVALQDAYVRTSTVRGLASTRELDVLSGKTIISAQETSVSVPGPVQLTKVFLAGDSGEPEDEDEMTVASWGVRRVKKE